MTKYILISFSILLLLIGCSSKQDVRSQYTNPDFAIEPISKTILKIEYPISQFVRERSGWVHLAIKADSDGEVFSVRVLNSSSGPQWQFTTEAMKSIRKWKFSIPASYDTSKEFNYVYIFNFQ